MSLAWIGAGTKGYVLVGGGVACTVVSVWKLDPVVCGGNGAKLWMGVSWVRDPLSGEEMVLGETGTACGRLGSGTSGGSL